MSSENQMKQFFARCLEDIKVECDEEFDRNFERKAFFSEAWQRRGGAYHDDKPLMMNTGQLRKSVTSTIAGGKLVYSSDLVYAGIHNEGGTITVTKKMKGYFWHKYYQATGVQAYRRERKKMTKKQDANLTTAAEFFKAMALMKVGRKIIVPRRQFVGWHPSLESNVRQIIEENLTEYFNSNEFQLSVK